MTQLKAESFILPLDSWKELKEYILTECHKGKDCEEVYQKINKIVWCFGLTSCQMLDKFIS